MDLKFSCEGSFWLLRHLTLAGECWIDQNIDPDEIRHSDGSVVVPQNVVNDIAAHARMEGLVVGSTLRYSPR